MGLFRIYKDAEAPFYQYSEDDTQHIQQWYRTGESSSVVNQLLKTCWEEQTWLQCDCQPEATPIMHVRRKNDGYHIVRMTRHGHHTEECVFSSKPFVYSAISKKHVSKDKEPDLHELLYELIYQSELNQMPLHARGYGRPINVQYEHLNSVVSNVLGDIYDEYSHLFITHPYGVKKCCEQVEICNETNSEPLTGYFFLMADSIKGNEIILTVKGKEHKIKIMGDSYIDSISHTGPWIGLITIEQCNKDDSAVLKNAVLMPAMRKGLLCPLRSDDQRFLKLIEPLKNTIINKKRSILCTHYLPNEDHYDLGLRFNISSGYRSVDIAIIHTEEGKDGLPSDCLYHFQSNDGTKHNSEKYLLEYIQKRLGLN